VARMCRPVYPHCRKAACLPQRAAPPATAGLNQQHTPAHKAARRSTSSDSDEQSCLSLLLCPRSRQRDLRERQGASENRPQRAEAARRGTQAQRTRLRRAGRLRPGPHTGPSAPRSVPVCGTHPHTAPARPAPCPASRARPSRSRRHQAGPTGPTSQPAMPLRARPARPSCPAPPFPARPASRHRTRLAMPSLLPPRQTERPVRRTRRGAAASLPRAAGPAGYPGPARHRAFRPRAAQTPVDCRPGRHLWRKPGRAGPGRDPADPRDARRRYRSCAVRTRRRQRCAGPKRRPARQRSGGGGGAEDDWV
jgi:hypothetical protein